MTRATLKKITDAEKNGGVVPAAKTITPKKRKAAAATAEDDDEEGGEETPKPTTRKSRGKGKKKADTPVEGEWRRYGSFHVLNVELTLGGDR